MLRNEDIAGATQAVALFRNRVLPLLFAGYLLNFLDRTNISYAQLQMGADLDISLAAYGLGAGLFSSATPASACRPTSRCSASASGAGWLSCSWPGAGVLPDGGAAGREVVLRVAIPARGRRGRLHPRRELLPGIVDSAAFRSRINAVFIMALPLAMIFGGPLAGVLLKIDLGMQGWRWLFLLEGLPTVLLGLLILRLLPATPEEAHWLSDAQRRGLRADGGRGRAAPAGRSLPGPTASPCSASPCCGASC